MNIKVSAYRLEMNDDRQNKHAFWCCYLIKDGSVFNDFWVAHWGRLGNGSKGQYRVYPDEGVSGAYDRKSEKLAKGYKTVETKSWEATKPIAETWRKGKALHLLGDLFVDNSIPMERVAKEFVSMLKELR